MFVLSKTQRTSKRWKLLIKTFASHSVLPFLADRKLENLTLEPKMIPHGIIKQIFSLFNKKKWLL